MDYHHRSSMTDGGGAASCSGSGNISNPNAMFSTNHHHLTSPSAGGGDGNSMLSITSDCFYAPDYWNIPYTNGLTPMKQIEGISTITGTI